MYALGLHAREILGFMADVAFENRLRTPELQKTNKCGQADLLGSFGALPLFLLKVECNTCDLFQMADGDFNACIQVCECKALGHPSVSSGESSGGL